LSSSVNSFFYVIYFFSAKIVTFVKYDGGFMEREPKVALVLMIALTLAFSPAEGARQKRSRKPSSTKSSDSTALEKIYRIQDQRISNDSFLVSTLYHPSSRVARASALAHARIADPLSVEELAKILNRKNREMQKLAAFALGQIGTDVALKILEQQAEWQRDTELRAALFLAIGKVGKESGLKSIVRAVTNDQNPQILQASLEALGSLWSGESAKWEVPAGLLTRLSVLARSKESYNVSASFALARFKGPVEQLPTSEILNSAASSPSPYARALLFRVLGKIKSSQVSTFLATSLSAGPDIGLMVEAAKALASQSPADISLAALKSTLGNPSTSVVVTALETIGSYGEASSSLSEEVEGLLQSNSLWLQEAALKTFVKIQPTNGRAKCLEILNIPSSPLRSASLVGLTLLGTSADLEKVFLALPAERTKTIVDVLEALLTLEDAPSSAHVKIIRKLLDRADVGITSQIGLLVEKHRWKEFASGFAYIYPQFQSPDTLEGKVASLNALAVVGNDNQVPLLESALRDHDKLVVSAAVAAIKAITGRDESSKIPLNSKVTDSTPSYSEISGAVGKTVQLKTTRGDIHIRLLDDAPVFAARFLKLVRAKFYEGKIIHRVVPNFVAQGGDPRGDGFGGPGFLVRDEVSPKRHWVGTVGLATAGRDTGGCQFFINLAPNLHLNGRYSIFAEVTKGMDVAEKLEAGDKILSARVSGS
jgi:cyclophilin family peptidyl-prolyl cis-trans isomerase